MESRSSYDATTRLIESLKLTPTEHSIWRTFLKEAVNPEYAAQYIWNRIHDRPNRPPEQILAELKIEWKQIVTKLTHRDQVSYGAQRLVEARDDSHCFMLRKKKPTYPKIIACFDHCWVIPPSFFDGCEMNPCGTLYAVLEAFLTPTITSELRTHLQTSKAESQLRNLFLLSPSIHSAFRNGHICIFPPTETGVRWTDQAEAKCKTESEPWYFVDRFDPEPCDSLFLSDGTPWSCLRQMFTMKARDPKLSLPDPFLLRTHFRLAASLHLLHFEERVAEGWPSAPLFSLNTTWLKRLRSLWHLVPKMIRVQCYSLLLKLGKYLYPRSSTGFVQRMPFGLYAKKRFQHPNNPGETIPLLAPSNEGETLRLLENYSSVPSPIFVDEYQEKTHSVLITTAIPGQTLENVFHRLSYPEREQLAKELKTALSQLRCIPNKTSHVFADSLGGPLNDHRLPSGTCGPFDLISEFNAFLVHPCVPKKTRETISTVHARQYRSLFTHGDLHPSNIIMDRGRLSGIVDWESAGFYPEYWEFTKLMYGSELLVESRPLIRDSCPEIYEEEFEAELALWNETPFGT